MRIRPITLLLLIALCLCLPVAGNAAKKEILDARIEAALEELEALSPAARKLMKKAEGVLVFPNVKKAGMGIGGEFGEGALLVDGDIDQYYNTVSASVGLQLGVQVKRQVLVFMDKSALNNFRGSEGFEIGVDGSVAVANLGAGGEIETKTLNQPVVAFIFGNKGLMYNLSLEGSKISPIEK